MDDALVGVELHNLIGSSILYQRMGRWWSILRVGPGEAPTKIGLFWDHSTSVKVGAPVRNPKEVLILVPEYALAMSIWSQKGLSNEFQPNGTNEV
jgi:hypothetical protein